MDIIKLNELEIDQSKDIATALDKLEDDVNAIVVETIDIDLETYFITIIMIPSCINCYFCFLFDEIISCIH